MARLVDNALGMEHFMMSLPAIGLPAERMLMVSLRTYSLSQQVRIARAHLPKKPMFALFTNTQNADMMPGNANTSPQCGRKAAITYNGKTVTGTLVDKCPGCVSPPHLLHPSLDGLLSP